MSLGYRKECRVLKVIQMCRPSLAKRNVVEVNSKKGR